MTEIRVYVHTSLMTSAPVAVQVPFIEPLDVVLGIWRCAKQWGNAMTR